MPHPHFGPPSLFLTRLPKSYETGSQRLETSTRVDSDVVWLACSKRRGEFVVRAVQLPWGQGSLGWEGGVLSSKPQPPGPASLPAFAIVGPLQVCGEKTAILRCCLGIYSKTTLLTPSPDTELKTQLRMPATNPCLVSQGTF